MPPPANNENQGLKIAVACLAMLSVILAVMTYFGFKQYGEANKNYKTADTEAKTERQEREKIERILLGVKERFGLVKTEDSALVDAAKKYGDEVRKKVAASVDEALKAAQAYKDANGGSPKIDEIVATLNTINSAMNDPAQTITSLADRLQEVLHNQALIAVTLATEYKTVRTTLESVNGINNAKIQVESDALAQTKKDLNDEHDKHEIARQQLMAKVDALQSDANKYAQEIATLKNQIAQKDDDFKKQHDALLLIVNDLRDQLQKKETVLDKRDGLITFVDYDRNEVRTDLTRTTGAREQMIMTIFDKAAPGLPTDKPKGTIELIQVGPNGSLARIVNTTSSTNPIRVGDQVYSSSWDPNRPQQFALIGKIDINRDGRDDREDLKRMIRLAGGSVVYDLPPTSVGSETGKLTPAIAWYVVDDRLPYHPPNVKEGKMIGLEDEGFLKKRAAAIAQARLDGIRPKPVERLLNELGYVYGAQVPGQVEAADRKAIQSLLNPKGRIIIKDANAPAETKKEEGEAPEGDKKADENKPEAEKPDAEKPDTDK